MAQAPRSAAHAALRAAARAGVDLCLANPGTTELSLVEALDHVPEIRAVLGLFEGVCTGAADGYGRMTGRPALTLLHLGPGFANGIANLHNARRAHTPIVNLIGDQASWHLEYDAPLTSDITSLAAPVSDWLHTSASEATLADDLDAAVNAACAPAPGVSTLIIPADHQWKSAAPERPHSPRAAAATSAPTIDSQTIDDIAAKIRAGASATLLLGGSALGREGQLAAGRIAARFEVGLLAETFPARWERGRGLPPVERLPYFPEQAQAALAARELVVLAGARPPVAFFGYDGLESRLADPERVLTLPGDPADALAALAACLEVDSAPAELASPGDLAAATGALDPTSIGQTLARHLPEGAIVMEEAATTSLPFYTPSMSAAPHTLLSLTGGAIGLGLPCATGAALACPDRKVIAFQADGSGMYTLQSLWTHAREQLDIVTLICSNRAYRILQVEMARAGIAEPGPQAARLTRLDQPELDWVALARGCGVPGIRVETADALEHALPRALAEPGPQLIEMMI